MTDDPGDGDPAGPIQGDLPDGEPLGDVAPVLRTGRRDPRDNVSACHDRIESVESDVQAWVDGPKERAWIRAEAKALLERYPDPDPDDRPPLFGVPVGVKDVIHVDGLPTRAGSDLPPAELAGPQATVVSRLRQAGALVLGKTVTTEFAWMAPGPTRNPYDLAHTPGGSSSGSAAAVAAGMVPLAVGTQTIGSVIRPAAFCGVVGFKPSYGRIPLDGVLPLAPSVDHVGLFARDVQGIRIAAGACVDDWNPSGNGPSTSDDGFSPPEQPTLGVPEGPYLDRATDVGRTHFEDHVAVLGAAGYDVERASVFENYAAVEERHESLVAAEAALAHHDRFQAYGDRFAGTTAELIEDGRAVSVGTLVAARRGRGKLRDALAQKMVDRGIDVWVSPAAPGPAPEGIDSTGDPTMNLPWTHAGFPTVTVPAARVGGLPVGLQCVAAFGADERLLDWVAGIEAALDVA